ncbi:hypothetical protein [Halorubrum salinum]|uniref:hypothetical protein n=1 Tax=Halorubrum salinum TaxID=767517 RepID=UPI0021121236|nr:hypothetical protein [Halorubrum salinum]
MSNAQYQVDGTPTWAVRRIVEIAVLLPFGVLTVGMMASPALLLLWLYSEVAFTAGVITTLWVGALSGTKIARGADIGEATDGSIEAEQPTDALVALFALLITVAAMISSHVIGVAIISAGLTSVMPASIVVVLPLVVSLADMALARKTGYSIFVLGFGLAYVALRIIEIVIDVEKDVFAGIGKPVLRLFNSSRHSFR